MLESLVIEDATKLGAPLLALLDRAFHGELKKRTLPMTAISLCVTEIIRRLDQGVTRPFLVRAEDEAL